MKQALNQPDLQCWDEADVKTEAHEENRDVMETTIIVKNNTEKMNLEKQDSDRTELAINSDNRTAKVTSLSLQSFEKELSGRKRYS